MTFTDRCDTAFGRFIFVFQTVFFFLFFFVCLFVLAMLEQSSSLGLARKQKQDYFELSDGFYYFSNSIFKSLRCEK